MLATATVFALGARCPVTGKTGSACGGARKLSETPATRPEHDAIKAAFLSGTPIEAIAGAPRNSSAQLFGAIRAQFADAPLRAAPRALPGPYEGSNPPLYPHDVMSCPTEPVLTTPFMDEALYDEVVGAVVGLLNGLPAACDADLCPRADFVGCVVRFVGHDLMDFRVDDWAAYASTGGGTLGGVDACLAFDDADNRGLSSCLASGGTSLAQAYAQVCDRVSLADFAVIAAEGLMAAVATNPAATAQMFKSNAMWGRTTATSCAHTQEGGLPNPEESCNDLERVFGGHVYGGHGGSIDRHRSTRCAGPICGAVDASHSGEYPGAELDDCGT